MRDDKANVIMATNKTLGDCPILVAECDTVRQAIIMAVKVNIPRICIHIDSQVVANAINRKIGIPKNIINLVEDIKYLSSYIKKSRLKYCSRSINRNAIVMLLSKFLCTCILLSINFLFSCPKWKIEQEK